MSTTTTIIDLSDRFGFGRAVLDERSIQLAKACQTRILAVNNLIPEGWPVGYEIDICNALKPVRLCEGTSAKLDLLVPGFVTRPSKDVGKVSQRPELELCLYNSWQGRGAHAQHFDRSDLDFLAGRLGTQTRWLEMRSAKTPSAHRLLFGAASDIETRLSAFLDHFNATPDPEKILINAIDSYLNFLLIHPFRDGNGFAARGLFQLYLNKHLGLRAPIFPITPIYYRNLDPFQYGYLSWSLARAGAPLVDVFVQTIGIIADFFEKEVVAMDHATAV